MSAPLIFQPTPAALYGFGEARRIDAASTPYQRIEIWDTPLLGTLFTLDGRPMTSTGDEFIYHECMVHPAALAHPAPRSALVLGGGDGGAARELLRHRGMRRVAVAELDAEVVRLTRQYLPQVHGGAFDDARVELAIGDAAGYVERVRQAGERFDLAVFDLTPPESPSAAGLYSAASLARLKQVLTRDALISMHLGSPWFHAARIDALLRDLRAAFARVRVLGAFVPLYGSLWLMAVASDTRDAADGSVAELQTRLDERGVGTLRFYEAAAHAGLFSVVRTVRDTLGGFPAPG